MALDALPCVGGAPVRSGELGVVEVEGDDDNGGHEDAHAVACLLIALARVSRLGPLPHFIQYFTSYRGMYRPGAFCDRGHQVGYTNIDGSLKLGATPPCRPGAGAYRHPAILPPPRVNRQRTHHRDRKPGAEVKRLGYVHARKHCPSSLLMGPWNAPVPLRVG